MTEPLIPTMSSAVLSEDGLYRYHLDRTWGGHGDGPPLTFVMLNPSTADADVDDPTIRRCIGFAKALGYPALHVVNLYAVRATNPDTLKHMTPDVAIGPDGDDALRDTFHDIQAHAPDALVIAAWGAWPGPDPTRPRFVQALAAARDVQLHALGVTKAGQPRHPLYLPGTARPTPWTAP